MRRRGFLATVLAAGGLPSAFKAMRSERAVTAWQWEFGDAPGFTVNRLLTEQSAGRIIGELGATNAQITRIHAQLARTLAALRGP